MNGYGVWLKYKEHKDKERYYGNFENDQIHGFGIYHYPDFSYYTGFWENGLRNGNGWFKHQK